jgi:signal transduction histidine kinase
VQAAFRNLGLVDETLEQQLQFVRGAEIRFRQVLLHLFSNAVKFTPSGDRERFLESSGADGYLKKPVHDSAQRVAQVRELMA